MGEPAVFFEKNVQSLLFSYILKLALLYRKRGVFIESVISIQKISKEFKTLNICYK